MKNSTTCIGQDSFDYRKQNLVSMFMKNTLKKKEKKLIKNIKYANSDLPKQYTRATGKTTLGCASSWTLP